MSINTRQDQKEQTHKKIIQIALFEFSRRGILATRMSDIAQAAGVSHGTIFAHFETQELLIGAVIEETGQKMAQRTHELAVNTGSLRQVLRSHLEGIREFEGFYTRLVIETRSLPGPARDILISIQSSISFHISLAAEHEIQSGAISPMPISLLFNTWIGLIHYYLCNGDLFAPGESVINRYGGILLDHFMALVKKETAFMAPAVGEVK